MPDDENSGDTEPPQESFVSIPELPRDGFKGHLHEDQLNDFTKRERRTLIAISKNEQMAQWLYEQLMAAYVHVRRLEARSQMLERMIRRQQNAGKSLLWRTVKWGSIVAGAAALEKLVSKLWP